MPGFTATFTTDEGSVTTRTLDEFYERQHTAFARTSDFSETLHNVRIVREGRLASVFADFRLKDSGEERPEQLMLLMIQDRGEFHRGPHLHVSPGPAAVTEPLRRRVV